MGWIMYRLDFRVAYCRVRLIQCSVSEAEFLAYGNSIREVPPVGYESLYGLFGLFFSDQHIVSVPGGLSSATEIRLPRRD